MNETCAMGSACWIEHPPQTPKCGQCGTTREGLERRTSTFAPRRSAPPHQPSQYLLARQRTGDEHDLAVVAGDAAPRGRATRCEATLPCSSWLIIQAARRAAAKLPFARRALRQRGRRRRRCDLRVASNAQVPRTGKRRESQAFLAGGRPVSSGSTEGASGAVRGAANLSGRADSKGKWSWAAIRYCYVLCFDSSSCC